MVRIPNSFHEWTEHVHSNGRKFLSNLTTNETQWLWTKWDMNGRLFVRNTVNPSRRVWVDEMDFAMRIESGIASQTEIQQYVTSRSQSNSVQTQTTANPLTSVQTPHTPHIRSQPLQQPQQHQSLRPLSTRPDPWSLLKPDFQPIQPHQPQNQFTQPPSNHSYGRFPPAISRPIAPSGPSTVQVDKRQRGTRFNANHRANSDKFPSAFRLANGTEIQHTLEPSVLHDASPRQQHDRTRSPQVPSVPFKQLTLLPKSKKVTPLKRSARKDPAAAQPRPVNDTPKRRRFESTRRAFSPALSPFRSLLHAPRAVQMLYSSAVSISHHPVFTNVYEHRVRGSSTSEGSASTFDLDSDDRYLYEPIVGTCEEIEKEYLRLTSAPKPEAVRPPRVLRLSLAHIKSIWASGTKGYGWVCRQLKSIRQDYTVQAVTDHDVVDVYKTHARIALENGDLGEFNTCVAQVQRLFLKVNCSVNEQDEFAAYRILYSVITSAKAWQVQREFARLIPTQRQWKGVQFAWQICLAVKREDYHNYFQKASCPPQHTVAHFLLVYLGRRMRHLALRAMVAAYGPGQPALLPLHYVAVELGWAPRDPSSSFREHSLPKLPEEVIESDDRELYEAFRRLGLTLEPAWVFQAVEFLISVNVDLIADDTRAIPSIDNSRVNAVFIDCKSTKSHGVGELKTNGKLITHAGSVSR